MADMEIKQIRAYEVDGKIYKTIEEAHHHQNYMALIQVIRVEMNMGINELLDVVAKDNDVTHSLLTMVEVYRNEYAKKPKTYSE